MYGVTTLVVRMVWEWGYTGWRCKSAWNSNVPKVVTNMVVDLQFPSGSSSGVEPSPSSVLPACWTVVRGGTYPVHPYPGVCEWEREREINRVEGQMKPWRMYNMLSTSLFSLRLVLLTFIYCSWSCLMVFSLWACTMRCCWKSFCCCFSSACIFSSESLLFSTSVSHWESTPSTCFLYSSPRRCLEGGTYNSLHNSYWQSTPVLSPLYHCRGTFHHRHYLYSSFNLTSYMHVVEVTFSLWSYCVNTLAIQRLCGLKAPWTYVIQWCQLVPEMSNVSLCGHNLVTGLQQTFPRAESSTLLPLSCCLSWGRPG